MTNVNNNYDIIIIGAGHNGLVAANYLAKAGKKILVLEARTLTGGQTVSESFTEGFRVDALHAGGQLRPDIIRDLGLEKFALAALRNQPYISVLPDGKRLQLSVQPNDSATLDSIRQFSEADAKRWPEFVAFMNNAAAFLDAAYKTPMPRFAKLKPLAEGLPLALLALKLRRLGGKDMFRVIRAMSMSALELTEEWFESDQLRAAIAAVAVHGSTLGSMSAGTGYTLMHNWLNRGGLAQAQLDGGRGKIAEALVAELNARGGEVRTAAKVNKILVDKQKVLGIQLDNGDEIKAEVIFSATDPRNTLLNLVGAVQLPPEFVWQVQSIKMRGSVAKIHCLTDGGHGLPAGTLCIAPSIKYIERAYDAAKYGEMSTKPYLEITSAGNVVSIHFQFAPYSLRNGDWASLRSPLETRAIDTVSEYFPQFRASIQQIKSITPKDLESIYGLTEGDLNHGQLILDQIFFMRPLPGYSNHKTPIDGLYLCGNGIHGGGGISGASGRNAAKLALKHNA